MRARLSALALVAALSLPTDASAQDAAKPAPPPPCSSPEHRAFDFWLGAWRAETAEGRLAGHNTISLLLGGCALLEEFEGVDFRGTALMGYDAPSRAWHSIWVDASGAMLRLEGALRGESMVLVGESRDERGSMLIRNTWTPQPGGSVEYRLESSRDGGASWEDVTLLIYKRR
jgi:hypothetical protein